jgi:3-methylfumaryl-CoA hydratase
MSKRKTDYADWIGSREVKEDLITLATALGVHATLDEPGPAPALGDPLPPLWHWFHFLPQVAGARIGDDGHPQRGGFLPPVDLPRRMFAGARVRFAAPLMIGEPATREGEVLKVAQKTGATGRLVFVTVGYRVVQGERVCIEEEQDIVYRESGGALPVPIPLDRWPDVATSAWSRVVCPDPVLLFRFSALTFNAHRIHYDRPYAMNEEGYPGLVVHGPLTAILLLGLARHNVDCPVADFSFRGQAPLFDLAPFRLVGERMGARVELEAHGPDGRTAMTASAHFDV